MLGPADPRHLITLIPAFLPLFAGLEPAGFQRGIHIPVHFDHFGNRVVLHTPAGGDLVHAIRVRPWGYALRL